jgi:hypothetical protein
MRLSRTALCVVRTWTEEDSPVLRAEISMMINPSDEFPRRVYITGATNVERVVREWLAASSPTPTLRVVAE